MALLVQLVAHGLQWQYCWVLAGVLAQHPTLLSLQAVLNRLDKQGHEHYVAAATSAQFSGIVLSQFKHIA